MRTYSRVLIVLVVVAVTAVIASRVVLPLLNGADVSSLSTQALFAASLPEPSGKVQEVKQWQGKVMVVNFRAPALPRRNAGIYPVTGQVPQSGHHCTGYCSWATSGVPPYAAILGTDGRMVKNHFGRINLQQLEQALQPLLAVAH